MNTLRDAEQKIRDLDRQVIELREEIRALKNTTSGPDSFKQGPTFQSAPSVPMGIHDYIITAGGNIILHNVKHIFKDVSVTDLEVESLEVLDGGNIPQIHISYDNSTQGTYIMDLAGGSYWAKGAAWDGANWKAKETEAMLLAFDQSTGFHFMTATGLVIGNNVTFTGLLSISLAGVITISPLTASRPLKLNASKQVISTQIDISSADDVTGALDPANGGTGETSIADLATALEAYFYTEAEVNTLISGKADSGTYSVTIASDGTHNHTETGTTTSSDGSHSHGASVTI